MEEKFMEEALELARQAAADGEVPVGCVIVRGDKIVGRGRNRRECSRNALAHAEVEAIRDACEKVDNAAKAGALAMGAACEIENIRGYAPLMQNASISRLFEENAGMFFSPEQITAQAIFVRRLSRFP